MERIEVTRAFAGICHMQVCAVKDATDEEILAESNRKNLCGTAQGWCTVTRDESDPNLSPKICGEDPGRIHFLVGC